MCPLTWRDQPRASGRAGARLGKMPAILTEGLPGSVTVLGTCTGVFISWYTQNGSLKWGTGHLLDFSYTYPPLLDTGPPPFHGEPPSPLSEEGSDRTNSTLSYQRGHVTTPGQSEMLVFVAEPLPGPPGHRQACSFQGARERTWNDAAWEGENAATWGDDVR